MDSPKDKFSRNVSIFNDHNEELSICLRISTEAVVRFESTQNGA